MTIFIDAIPSNDEIGKAKASLDMIVAVGFGLAQVTKDDELVFRATIGDEDFHTLQEFEDYALADPDHDWRVLLDAPLRMREYQRQGPGKWVVVAVGPGFA
jgi:hypothetical protein